MSYFNNINVGVTGFVFDSRYTFTGLGYLAICWQKQWGKSTSTGEYVTHTFSIKFTVIPIVVAGALTSNTSGNTGSQSNPCYRSITVSNFVFCMYDNARGYAGSTYIAIGYQLQWVICSNQKMVYPIPFTEVLAFSKTNEHYYMDENVAFTREVSIQSIGTDSMSCYRYGTKTSVILIGV